MKAECKEREEAVKDRVEDSKVREERIRRQVKAVNEGLEYKGRR